MEHCSRNIVYWEKDFVESKNLATVLKIILLDYQSNYRMIIVER